MNSASALARAAHGRASTKHPAAAGAFSTSRNCASIARLVRSLVLMMVCWFAVGSGAVFSATLCGNQVCEPQTIHEIRVWQTDGNGHFWEWDVNAGGLAGAVTEFCANQSAYTSAFPGQYTFKDCVPVLPIADENAGGATSGGLSLTGVYEQRNTAGTVIASGPWGQGLSIGCVDSVNADLQSVGTNAQCYCRSPMQWDPVRKTCLFVKDKWKIGRTCEKQVGNPIVPLVGAKVQRLELGISIGKERLAATYDTRATMPYDTQPTPINGAAQIPVVAAMSLGKSWTTSIHKSLYIQRSPSSSAIVHAVRGDAQHVSFERPTTTSYVPLHPAARERIVPVLDGSGNPTSQVRLIDAAGNIELYDMYDLATATRADLISISYASGGTISYTYSNSATLSATAPYPGLLVRATDHDGRVVNFRYEPSGMYFVARLKEIATADGRVTSFSYNESNMLTQITWPDGKVRKYLYERADLTASLTGIVDENDSRLATYAYDALGTAISTEYAGGVDKYSVTYGVPPKLMVYEELVGNVLTRIHQLSTPQDVSLQLPNGTSSALAAIDVGGVPYLSGQTQPAGSGCQASSNAVTYDASGNVLSQDDFQGVRTCYAYDASNRETVRVEGLSSAVACDSVTPAGAALPANARKVTTAWHPDWRLPRQVVQPLRTTTTDYHDPDNVNGQGAVNCTSAGALPNGKPLPLVCQVQQSAPDATRTVSFTYDGAGRVLKSVDENSKTTTFAYYADTAFTGIDPDAVGHTAGDLQSAANAAGHTTTFTLYDKAGRLRQSIDARGVTTDITYTPRGWVSTVTTTANGLSPRVTAYGYDNAGQRTQISPPDGTSLTYDYDAAHRLVGITDARGNAITYTLDGAGNRTAEDLRDPSGTLRRTITRSFDALNRIQQVTAGVVSGRVGSLTTIAASPNPVPPNTPVNITVQVTGNAPAGTVSFYDGSTSLGSAPLSNGTASITPTFTTIGPRSLSAAYDGDEQNTQSTSTGLLLQVLYGTSTSLSATPNPAVVGSPVTLTAQVTGSTPVGTVTFKDGANILGAAALSNGVATFAHTFADIGGKSLTAVYGGDARNGQSTSAVIGLTARATSATTISPSPDPSVKNFAMTLTAQVTGTSPTGTVTFRDGSTLLGAAPLSTGSANLTHTFTNGGTKLLTAEYGGDSTNAPSTSAVRSHTVLEGAVTTVTMAVSPATVQAGYDVQFTASVAGATPTGTVSFLDGQAVVATATLSNGAASAVASLSTAGTRSLSASYSGDATNAASSSGTQSYVVTKLSTMAILSCPTNVHPGDSFTCTVTVDAAVHNDDVSNGTCSVSNNYAVVATSPITQWVAPSVARCSVTMPGMVKGIYPLRGHYSGTASTAGSVSPVTNLDVK